MYFMNTKPPATGSIIQRRQGSRRYYYYSRSFRVKLDPASSGKGRGSGKSRVVTEQIYLGSAEEVLEKLQQPQPHLEPRTLQKKAFGLPMALFEMAERIGLREVINGVVPGKVKDIGVGDFALIAAINRVGNHTCKERMGQWYHKTDLARFQKVRANKLNSQTFWYAFDKIVSEAPVREQKAARGFEPNGKIDIEELETVLDDQNIAAIERGLWQNLARRFGFLLDVVLYDTTNFYTYHQNDTPNSLAQFGKNKQNQNDKRQVGLQLALLKDLGVPVFHSVYGGHQNDARLFPTAIRTLVARCEEVSKKTERFVVVFDKGNNSEENVALLDREPIDFVGSLSPSQHRDLATIPLAAYGDRSGKFLVHRTRKKVFGQPRTVVLTYHEPTAKFQQQGFEAQMQRVMKAAKEFFQSIAKDPTDQAKAKMETFLKTHKVGTSRALRYYDFELHHNGWVNVFHLRRKRSEVALKKASFGKKILFTNLHEASTEKILELYKGAYQIEDTFHHIKDRDLVAYAPAFHWTDSKIRVHAFVCVLALLLLKLLHILATKNEIEMSTKLLIEELEDIAMIVLVYPNRKAVRKVSEMSRVQRRLFDLFELDRYTRHRN